jgi:hypothetical protein
MAAATEKVSVSIDARDLKWIRTSAKKEGVSLSALLSTAVRRFREEDDRRAAQRAFLATFSAKERATPREMDALEAEWRG